MKMVASIVLIVCGIFTESFVRAGWAGCLLYSALVGLALLGVVFPRGKHERRAHDE